MNLVWHIVHKDIRRHWLPYLIWIGLLLARIVICAEALSPASADHERLEKLQITYGVATVIMLITGFLLAASFALEDELVGTQMFWATRPIGGMRLLAAKVIGLVLFFVVAPVLVSMPWWLYCGSGVRELYEAAVVIVLSNGIPALAALWIAALTGKSSRFLLILLSALLLGLLWGALSAGRMFQVPYIGTDIALARDILVTVLVVCAVLSAVWLQYRTRRTAWSTGLAVMGIALGLWAGRAWPWGFTQTWRGETKSDVGLEGVDIRWVSLTRSTVTGRMQVAGGYVRLQVKFEARNVPEALRLSRGLTRISLTWPDGLRDVQETALRTSEPEWIARSVLGVAPDMRQADPETRAYWEKKVADRKAKPGLSSGLEKNNAGPYIELTGELIVPLVLADRLDRELPDCVADVHLDFRRPTVQLETPLVVGAEVAGRAARIRVLADVTLPKDKNMHVEMSYSVAHYDAVHDSWLNAVFQRSTGVMTVQTSPLSSRSSVFVQLAPFSLETVRFQLPRVRRGEDWVSAPGADETPKLAVAIYEGMCHAQRQCVLAPTRQITP